VFNVRKEKAVFMGRAIPIDSSSNSLFNVMGSVNEYSVKLWTILSGYIDEWSREFFEMNPNSTTQDFFRHHHARLRKAIRAIESAYSRY
jgi:hypothetical protein